jgi:hypothetical protein
MHSNALALAVAPPVQCWQPKPTSSASGEHVNVVSQAVSMDKSLKAINSAAPTALPRVWSVPMAAQFAR